MSVVLLEAGALIVLAKYIFKKKNSKVWYFRRRIPEDVLGHYPSKQAKDLVFSLQTTDEGKAAGLAHKKATEQDALWHRFRTGEVAEGPDLVNVALAILSKFGLKPDQSKTCLMGGRIPIPNLQLFLLHVPEQLQLADR